MHFNDLTPSSMDTSFQPQQADDTHTHLENQAAESESTPGNDQAPAPTQTNTEPTPFEPVSMDASH
ncbi:MAG: hypothetical protein U1E02_38930, partial [Hydrogenophaga sp.]|nr:hypothetical protein [Hydrogenophaga sp.]